MVVPGGAGPRIAGGLLALGAVLAVVATFLPFYSYGSGASGVTIVSGWTITSRSADRISSIPSVGTGIWLLVVALVALAGAVAVLATPRARAFGAFGAGFLAAATIALTLTAVSGLLVTDESFGWRIDVGSVVLLLAAVCGIAGGIVAAVEARPRAAVAAGPYPPGPYPPGPPQAAP